MVLFLQLALWDTYVQSFVEGNLKKRDNLEDLCVDGRVLLK